MKTKQTKHGIKFELSTVRYMGGFVFALDFRGALDPVDCTNELCGLRVVLMPARV